jgi:DNA uptake protein ComE-like DNA-binding protein
MPGGETYEMEGRSLAVLRLRRENAKQDDEDEEADIVEQTTPTPTQNAPRRIRINTANREELLEVSGLRPEDAEAIVRFRDEHGPIADPQQLSSVLGGRELDAAIRGRIDFDPANQTAPEAPGA